MILNRVAIVLAAAALCVGVGPATAGEAPIPLAKVDIPRMYGGWYLIATVRNSFERGMVAPYDVYSRGARDDEIREDFYVRHGSFAAPVKHFTVKDFVAPGTGGGHWRVRIVWPLKLPFLVLYVDPQYRYALFGEDDRKLGWVYSRTPTLPDADYNGLLDRFAALGYDRGRFVKFVQTPDQIGRPGVWSEGIH